MILFLVLAGVQVGLLLLASRCVFRRSSPSGRMTSEAARNVLVSVVRELPARGRRALYAAANSGRLRRGTWDGCAFNRAGEILGMRVRGHGEAALVLGTTEKMIGRFLHVWDGLSGSNRHCTAILREALEDAGLFDEDDVYVDVDVDADAEVRRERLVQAPATRPASPRLRAGRPPGRHRGPKSTRTCGRPRGRGRCEGRRTGTSAAGE